MKNNFRRRATAQQRRSLGLEHDLLEPAPILKKAASGNVPTDQQLTSTSKKLSLHPSIAFLVLFVAALTT